MPPRHRRYPGHLFVLAGALSFTATASAQESIPVRQLGPAEVAASPPINVIANIRPLSDGRVLVGYRGRVFLSTPDLSKFDIVFDSSKMTPGNTSLSSQIPMVPYLADSTLLVDRNASSFVLLGPDGNIVRPMAAPIARDLREISGFFGSRGAHTDPRGRLIYRGRFPFAEGQTLTAEDSMPILRADFTTRVIDTIAVVRMPGTTSRTTVRDNNVFTSITKHTPFPVVDLWTVLADGTIAIARGADYHVDFIDPAGTKTSSPKLPFAWRRIADEEKTRVLDSIRVAETEVARRDSIQNAARPVRTGSTVITNRWTVAEARELPDYYPPLRETGMRPDPEGNVWLLPTTSAIAQGGLLYDVVSRRGALIERVQLPPGCALGAIAREGVVYLICGEGRLERRRVVR